MCNIQIIHLSNSKNLDIFKNINMTDFTANLITILDADTERVQFFEKFLVFKLYNIFEKVPENLHFRKFINFECL